VGAELMRREDWPERLAALLAERERLPFAWGERDCCLFAADCVLAVTGVDPAAELRGTYATAGEAGTLLFQRFGGGVIEMIEAMALRHGWEEIPVGLAGRGDLVLIEDSAGHVLPAVVDLDPSRIVFMHETRGLARMRKRLASRAWRIA